MLYDLKKILQKYPRCSSSMIRNYRWKTGIGVNINNHVYFTEKEVDKFIEDVESENEKMRNYLYNFIKLNPGIRDCDLHQHLGKRFTKSKTQELLADISEEYSSGKYHSLYEDDESRLFVEGHELNLEKEYDIKNGIFY